MRKNAEADLWKWPKLSTISIYNQAPQRIFSTDDRTFDLSDMLTLGLDAGECKTAFLGVAMPGGTWKIWSEENLLKIEGRIRYLFEFEGYDIEIERISAETDPWFAHEFIWKLTFWLEL